MFACLHGTGNLTGLAMEFSPTVEATGPDTVTFDVAGLDRLFGLPQDVAAAIARRAIVPAMSWGRPKMRSRPETSKVTVSGAVASTEGENSKASAVRLPVP